MRACAAISSACKPRADALLAPDVRAALCREAGLRSAFVATVVGGGAGKTFLRAADDALTLFVKLLPARRCEELDAEADGLEALRRTATVAVPAVRALGEAGGQAFLALDWLALGAPTPRAERRLGRALAALHRTTSDRFGYPRANAIGPTRQVNTERDDWLEFVRRERLGAQLELARANGLPRECAALVERVLDRLETLFDGHRPVPSLLHGDLWGGNWGAAADDTPFVFDPAVYYGDREADIAMTRLFGGFGPEFYRAYDEAWPLDRGAARRVDLYNAYHLLNHFNLFGAGYVAPLRAALERCLRA